MAGGVSRAKTKKWTSFRPVAAAARNVRSACARGPLHVSKMAQQQPRRKCPNQLARALEPQAARAYRLRERHRAGPHARDRAGVGADDEVDVEAWIFEADVGAFTREDEPARLKAAAARRERSEVEPDDHAPRRQLRQVDPSAHVPHQEHEVQVLGIELRRAPALAPLAQSLEHLAELLRRAGRPVLTPPSPAERLALHDAGVLELAQPLGQKCPRDHRQALTDLVESAGAGQELAQDQRRPPLGKGLARDCDRAELSIAFHGRHCRRRPGRRQVHFLVLAPGRPPAIVLPSKAAPQGGMTMTTSQATGDRLVSDWTVVARELGPRFAARAAANDAADRFVAENYNDLRERRVLAAGVPSELGGGGASHAELCAMVRVLAQYCGSTALALSMHTHQVAIAGWRWRHESAAVEPLLRRVAAEQLVLVSTGGSDWLAGSGRAEKVEGGYRITARKAFASASPVGNLLMTTAVYDDPEAGPTVLHVVIPFDAAGMTVQDNWRTLGMRATGSNDIVLDGVVVPNSAIGVRRPAGRWSHAWHVVVTFALPLIVSVYVGVAEAARTLALSRGASRRHDAAMQQAVGRMETELATA